MKIILLFEIYLNGAASEIRTRTICLEGRYTSHYTNAAAKRLRILHYLRTNLKNIKYYASISQNSKIEIV